MLQSRQTPSVRAEDYGRNHQHMKTPKIAYGPGTECEETLARQMKMSVAKSGYTPHKETEPLYNLIMDKMSDGRERTIGDMITILHANGFEVERFVAESIARAKVKDGTFQIKRLPHNITGFQMRRGLFDT